MNLKQLQQFVTLAETGNMRRAAERLHMAQPPLSVSLQKLEQELGGSLFHRGPRGVTLTLAGQAMLQDARQALFHAEQCRQRVTATLHGEGGLLRVGFIGTATTLLLPRLIPSFRKRYPGVDLQLTEATTQEAVQGVLDGRFDVGLVRYPMLHSARLRLTELDEDEFVLAVPEGSKLARHARIALSAARDEAFVMYEEERVPSLHAVAMMRCHQSGFVPKVAQEALQVQTLLSLVESGVGVALVAGVSQRFRPTGVKFLKLTDTPKGFRLGIAAVYAQSGSGLLLEAFVEQARKVSR